MSDIFLQEDIEKLLANKFVVVIGDSNQRAIYKDLVLLLQKNKYLTSTQLRAKGEFSFESDDLIEGGKIGKMTNGTGYHEVRQFKTDFHLIRFYFVTRCYNKYVESILKDLQQEPKPDVIIMNSCLWDISRYGPNSIGAYKKNLEKVFTRFNQVLSKQCMVIWLTTLPISKDAKGGFLVPEIEFLSESLRLDILEANFFAKKIVVNHGFDVLDLHFYLRHQLDCRAKDGVHWDMTAHRRVSNLLLTHISEGWNIILPGRVKKKPLAILDVNANECSSNKNMNDNDNLSDSNREDSPKKENAHKELDNSLQQGVNLDLDNLPQEDVNIIEKVHVDPPTQPDCFELEAQTCMSNDGSSQNSEVVNKFYNQYTEPVLTQNVNIPNRHIEPVLPQNVSIMNLRTEPVPSQPVNIVNNSMNYGYNQTRVNVVSPNPVQTFVAPSYQNNYTLPAVNYVQRFQNLFQNALTNAAFKWQPYNQNNVQFGRYEMQHYQQGRFDPYTMANGRGRRAVTMQPAMMGW